jgi:hypothetical protein
MIPPRFEYHAPKTVGEAVALLGQLGSDAKLLAGGHSLLPMMKLHERDGGTFEAGWRTMRSLLLLRADRRLVASDAEVDRLVEFSGGHPRELLRLLKLCCEVADDQIDANVVETAIKILAAISNDLLVIIILLSGNVLSWQKKVHKRSDTKYRITSSFIGLINLTGIAPLLK